MSTDHVLAAQMWTWPDPMIKRDNHGRILVVNAAFLQLYGGTVDSWTGNPIQGWPNPKAAGESARFESRIPLPTGGEVIYDWMETVLQDGTALAMARDVTIYAQAATTQVQPDQQPTQIQQAQADMATELAALSPVAEHRAPDPEPVTHVQTPADNFIAEPEIAPEPEKPAVPALATGIAAAAAGVVAFGTQETQAQTPAAEQASAPTPSQTEKSPVVAPLPIETPTANDQKSDIDRDFQRRALPIEDGDAILGNNWRDAVIAKAVGVDNPNETSELEETSENSTAMTSSTGEQIRVLLAEDNAINALLTRTLLEAEGCLCDVVEDGALAVDAVKNAEYDLVFMDMRMPNMDGLEATRKIRAMGHGPKALPIVALTANAFDDDRNACFDSGMNDFMTKPVSAEELSAMVQSHTSLQAEKIAS